MADMNEKWRERCRRLQEWQRQGKHTPALHVEESEAHVCLNCGTEFRGHFCPGCGQKADTQRLTLRHVMDNLVSLFTNADGRLWHTLRDLFGRPGFMMRDYMRGHRAEYIPPIQLLFFLPHRGRPGQDPGNSRRADLRFPRDIIDGDVLLLHPRCLRFLL